MYQRSIYALEIRYRDRGRVRVFVEMGLALATGKLTPAALKKGMNLCNRFSTPETFLKGHHESEERMAQVAATNAGPRLATGESLPENANAA